jgi:hypothetical protein
MSTAELIDQVFEMRERRLVAQRELDALFIKEKELIAQIQADLNHGASPLGTKAKAALSWNDEADVTDWAAFQAHIRATGELDLLQKRPMVSAIKARWEQGDSVPGVSKIEVETCKLSKL